MYRPNPQKQYWVVRAEGGVFYRHFIAHSTIAIGHLDPLNLPECLEKPFLPTTVSIQRSVNRLGRNEDKSKQQITSHFHQIKTFIHEMNVGDWVLTIGKRAVRFGRIVGEPRLSKAPLVIKKDEKDFEMPHQLRRKVVWGPELTKHALPYGLQLSLRSNQTVFSISPHIEAILHTLYSCFAIEDSIFFSTKIETNKQISNYYVARFLLILNDIEVLANCFTEINDTNTFSSVFNEYTRNHDLLLTTKANFHSPGQIWTKLKINKKKMFFAFSIYSMLFGNSQIGIDGIIDLETRQKLWNIVIEQIHEKKEFKEIQERLKLILPEYDTKPLEDNKHDEQAV